MNSKLDDNGALLRQGNYYLHSATYSKRHASDPLEQ